MSGKRPSVDEPQIHECASCADGGHGPVTIRKTGAVVRAMVGKSSHAESQRQDSKKDAEVNSSWTALNQAQTPVWQRRYELAVHDLTYKVVKKTKEGTVVKELLSSISACARPGEVLAVVGPSGSGKSTFLDAIAGRIEPSSLRGTILVNGVPMAKGFRRMSCYVMQDDALFPTLTVRETLMFSARLRLPSSMTMAQKKARVDDLLAVLGLGKCADTAVGDEDVRGVSGGEKRRCSIGVDLIHDPAVLFLDEPTSGLDSTSALNVVEVLHSLASERQRTVILSIHQPSFRIVDLLDSLLVLAHGRRIFHGRPRELYTFFDSIGQTVPEYVNPLEYVLDLIELQQDSPDGLNGLVASQGGRLLQVGRTTLADGRGEGSSTAGGGPSMDQKLREAPEYASSAWEEILTLCERDAINTRRTRSLTMSRVIVMIVIGTTAGSAFYNLPYTLDGARERTALLAFLVSLLCYNSMDALPVFLQHREVFVRETSRGAYRTWTYVVANFVVPLPLFLLLAVILSLCTYWLAHLVRTGQAFLFHALTCFLTLVTANSFVLFSTSVAPNFYAANGIVAGLYCLWFLFCGFFLVRTDIPAPWIWMHYFNIYKYPLENLLWIEFTPLKDTCFAYGPALSPAVSGNMTALSPSPLPPSCVEDGRGVLQALDLGKIKPLFNTGIMLLFTLSFRLAFFYFLRITTTSTRK